MSIKSPLHSWLLTFALLSFGPWSDLRAAPGRNECLKLYERALQTGREVQAFDTQKMRAWVEAQPPKIRPFAEMLTRRYELVSTASFREHVASTTRQLLAEIPKEKLVFVYMNSTFNRLYKSGAWVTGLIYDQFPDLRDVPAAALNNANFRVVRCANPPCVYVYVDDASYSGQQAGEQLEALVDLLSQTVGSAARVVALIPFVTQKAKARIEDVENPPLGILRGLFQTQTTAKVYYDRVMKTVKVLAAEEGVPFPETFGGDAVRTVTYFGHKIADGLSTMLFFTEGIVLEQGEFGFYSPSYGRSILFIPKFDPPYQVPTRPGGDQ